MTTPRAASPVDGVCSGAQLTLFSATCAPTSALVRGTLTPPSDLCREGMEFRASDDGGRLEGGELHHSPPQQFWVWLRNNYQRGKKRSGRTSLGAPITGAPNALGVSGFGFI